jgi:SAM-dependent methyltransferase
MKSFIELSPGIEKHLDYVKYHYSSVRPFGGLSIAYRKMLAHRYNFLIHKSASVLEVGCGAGDLLSMLNGSKKTGIDISSEQISRAKERFPETEFIVGSGEHLNLNGSKFDVIILSDVLNEAGDVQELLKKLHACSHDGTRLLINIYNTVWSPLIRVAKFFGITSGLPAVSWLSRTDVLNLLNISGWMGIKSFGAILIPFPIPVLAPLINRWLTPFLTWICLAIFVVARRPIARKACSVSVIVPARNEAGSISQVFERVPALAEETELIFVEGHSKDNTWEVISQFPDRWAHGSVKKLQQSGKGKGNAVIEGFQAATGDIVMILDADLTMPPEDLPKFVEVLTSGIGDFANGVRLVYPMDEKAMKFANLIANKSFSLIFSWLLGQSVKDTLCGTKVMWRADYLRLHEGRAYFGPFDPFGDFDLLFGADKLSLKIVDVPVRYSDRIYGDTNINRWRDGWILLKMVFFAARRIKFI